MQITIMNLKSPYSFDEIEAIELALAKYKIKKANLKKGILVKKSLDIRDKTNPNYVYQLVLELNDSERNNKNLKNKNVILDTKYTDEIEVKKVKSMTRPIIVGFGPAGMFCAYILALAGLKPLVLERGKDVDSRAKDIDTFFNTGEFDYQSNVCFGEGGAGTFSDGKLNTGVNDPKIRFILKTFVEFGANKNVYYDAKPHVGTDKLREVVKGIRNKIIELGGEIRFNSWVSGINKNMIRFHTDKESERDPVIGLGTYATFETEHIILAIGHSARDTYRMLYKNGFKMEPKPFSMGVRIEHLAKDINKIQYGNFDYESAASYKAAVHLKDRDVYTFCMCPGGYVVPSNSDDDEIVTNGMSYSDRAGLNSNSALLVNVRVDDYYKDSPLDGIYFQNKYERECYDLTGSYKAPTNLLKEFLEDEVAKEFRSVKPTYPCGTEFTTFTGLLPDFVIKGLKEGIKEMDKLMPGFLNDDAILTAVESRSSSPLRILRDKNYKSSNPNVYPIGEGAGYAGGITSSALDGIKCALSIIEEIGGKGNES